MTILKTRRFTTLAMLTAVAIVLSIFESVYIGPIFGILRIGLANIASLLALRMLGRKEMAIVSVMRVVFGNLLRGMIFGSTFWISAGGVLLSSLVMILCDRFDSSILFTSVAGAISHSLGQVLVVASLYMQAGIMAILPYLLTGSVPTGFLTGIVADQVLKRIRPMKTE